MTILYAQTMGNIMLLNVDADPNGSDAAPTGSLAINQTTGDVFQNRGGTVWAPYTTSRGGFAGGASPANAVAFGDKALATRPGSIVHASLSPIGSQGSHQTEFFNMRIELAASDTKDLELEDGGTLLSADYTAYALDGLMIVKEVGVNDAQILKWQCAWRRESGPATLAGFVALNVSYSGGSAFVTLSEASNTTTGAMRIVCMNNTASTIYVHCAVRMAVVRTQ